MVLTSVRSSAVPFSFWIPSVLLSNSLFFICCRLSQITKLLESSLNTDLVDSEYGLEVMMRVLDLPGPHNEVSQKGDHGMGHWGQESHLTFRLDPEGVAFSSHPRSCHKFGLSSSRYSSVRSWEWGQGLVVK